jgi:predicted PhzF superfamily epimerase YddE/YHI9
MHELQYFVVDVFTEVALAGNPLAVVMEFGWTDNGANAGHRARVQPI